MRIVRRKMIAAGFGAAMIGAAPFTGAFAESSVSADAAAAPEATPGWAIELQGSAMASSGNTENTNLGFKAKLKREIGRFVHLISGSADFAQQTTEVDGQDKEKTVQDRWVASYQVDTQIRDHTHGYARVQYDEDRFSGFKKRWFAGAGLGHDVVASEGVTWSVEAGPGYRWAELVAPHKMPDGFDGQREEFAAYADSNFGMQINDNVVLEQNSNVTYAASNTTYDTAVGLETKLTETVSSKLSYEVKYETDPPEGRKNKDTMLRASLLLGF